MRSADASRTSCAANITNITPSGAALDRCAFVNRITHAYTAHFHISVYNTERACTIYMHIYAERVRRTRSTHTHTAKEHFVRPLPQ